MIIRFDNDISTSSKFSDSSIREKIAGTVTAYAEELPKLYPDLDQVLLDKVQLHIVDASNDLSRTEEAFTIRHLNTSEFVIAIRQFDGPVDMFLLLAHELCHVAQYLSGMMDDSVGYGIVIWCREKIPFHTMPYKNRPWEKDACENQWKLYKLCNYKSDSNYDPDS